MGSGGGEPTDLSSSSSSPPASAIAQLQENHKHQLENLTLVTQPLKTLKFFIFGVVQYMKRSILYLLAKRGWFLLLSTVLTAIVILLFTIEGPQEKHAEEIRKYFEFGLWWIILGVASSIGLGSGLHTFVLYLGPHIAFFTIKAMQCGRVDLKIAPYDTIQLKRGPSWLDKDCAEFGPPLFTTSVPLGSVLAKVQIEAILWGLGTAIGELPPYFISRAASISGSKVGEIEELNASATKDEGIILFHLNKIKRWFLSHSQHMNFGTILLLASVPNPLFDLAGIMCGQFGIPFWKFFLATLIGKAIVKTHIQTIFIISVCNNQLLDWIENELIWILSLVPGLDLILPNIITRLKSMKEKYHIAPSSMTPNIKGRRWDFSFASIWNMIVWLMIMNFAVKIINETAQRYLKRQQVLEEAEFLRKHHSQ